MEKSQRLDIIPRKRKLVEEDRLRNGTETDLNEGTDSCENCILNFQVVKIRGKTGRGKSTCRDRRGN